MRFFLVSFSFIFSRFPLRSKVWITQCKANIVLVCLWSVSLAMAMYPHIPSTHVHVYFNHHIMICDIYLNFHPHLSILMAGVFFALPNLLMVVAYIAIYKVPGCIIYQLINKSMIVGSIPDIQSRKRYPTTSQAIPKSILLVTGSPSAGILREIRYEVVRRVLDKRLPSSQGTTI